MSWYSYQIPFFGDPRGFGVGLAVWLAQGLDYLHTREPTILHRDVKGGNILVGENRTDTGGGTADRPRESGAARGLPYDATSLNWFGLVCFARASRRIHLNR